MDDTPERLREPIRPAYTRLLFEHVFEREAAPMNISTTRSAVALWFVDGTPDRLVHDGTRWRVTDTPTEMWHEPAFVPALITHPPQQFVGWRFQATDGVGTTHMFEVLRDGAGQWVLGRVYD